MPRKGKTIKNPACTGQINPVNEEMQDHSCLEQMFPLVPLVDAGQCGYWKIDPSVDKSEKVPLDRAVIGLLVLRSPLPEGYDILHFDQDHANCKQENLFILTAGTESANIHAVLDNLAQKDRSLIDNAVLNLVYKLVISIHRANVAKIKSMEFIADSERLRQTVKNEKDLEDLFDTVELAQKPVTEEV